MSCKNLFTRFLWRKDLIKRIQVRFNGYKRRLIKSELVDLAALFEGKPPQVIFDVGANVGFLTWHFRKIFPQAMVYAFEPDPVPRQTLESAHRDDPQIRIFPLAAADQNGELTFVQRSVSCNSSLMQADGRSGGLGEHAIQVQARTLDHFCAEESVPRIDLLKIDTEGADLLVLQGAKNLLKNEAIDVIMLEVFFLPTYQQQATFDEIARFLSGYGYGLFNFYAGRETAQGQVCYGNAIFVRQGFPQAPVLTR